MASKFGNRESWEQWSIERPEQAIALGVRCGLRAVPDLISDVESGQTVGELVENEGFLVTLRALNITAVRCLDPLGSSELRSINLQKFPYWEEHAQTAASSVMRAAFHQDFSPGDIHSAVIASKNAAEHSAFGEARKGAGEVAKSNAEKDATALESEDADSIFSRELWNGDPVPIGTADLLKQLIDYWTDAGSRWEFWKQWYEGFLDGHPLKLDVLRHVALIPDDDWDKGAEHISAVIGQFWGSQSSTMDRRDLTEAVETERKRSGEALRGHVRRLLTQSAAAEICAVGLAWQVKSAINEYCNKNGVNEAPEELRSFEAIANVLARIGGSLAQARIDGEIREDTVDQLEAQIAELQLRIKLLERELATSQAKEVKGLIKNGFFIGIGTQLSVACTASIVGAATYFIAPELAPDIARSLGDRFTGMFDKPSINFPQIGKN